MAANHLNRNFSANKLNQFWVADITYLYTQEGWLYLSTIMDLYSRKIIGWSLRKQITKELVITALHMAIKQRKLFSSLLLHSDGVVNMLATITRYCLQKKVSYVP